MALSFGVTVRPDPPATRLVELMALGEENGFEIGWTYDSHVLWQDSFPLLTLAIQATSRMRFGHLVTNPGTREPTVVASLYATLHDISDGRMVMGIGRGDSARRYIGQKPVRVAEFEEAYRIFGLTSEPDDIGRHYTEVLRTHHDLVRQRTREVTDQHQCQRRAQDGCGAGDSLDQLVGVGE